MSKSTISTFELFQMFPDAEAARLNPDWIDDLDLCDDEELVEA